MDGRLDCGPGVREPEPRESGPVVRGADGTGVLATVTFTATGKGETSLSLQDVKLVQAEIDEAGAPIVIPAGTEDGKVTVAAGDGFAWLLWAPVIGVGAILIAAAGLAGWRRLARGR